MLAALRISSLIRSSRDGDGGDEARVPDGEAPADGFRDADADDAADDGDESFWFWFLATVRIPAFRALPSSATSSFFSRNDLVGIPYDSSSARISPIFIESIPGRDGAEGSGSGLDRRRTTAAA
jgi:hypothetical protein